MKTICIHKILLVSLFFLFCTNGFCINRKKDVDYANRLCEQADSLIGYTTKYHLAADKLNEAIAIYSYFNADSEFVVAIDKVVDCYDRLNQNNKAYEVKLRQKKHFEDKGKTNDPKYPLCLSAIGNYLYKYGKKEEALQLKKEAIFIGSHHPGVETWNYEKIISEYYQICDKDKSDYLFLDNCCYNYICTNNYNDVIDRDIYEGIINIYYSYENNPKVQTWTEKAIQKAEELHNSYDLSILAWDCYEKNNYELAIKAQTKAIEMSRKEEKEIESYDLRELLNYYMSLLGNFNLAQEKCTENIDDYVKENGQLRNTPDFFSSIAKQYASIGNMNQTFIYRKKAIERYQNQLIESQISNIDSIITKICDFCDKNNFFEEELILLDSLYKLSESKDNVNYSELYNQAKRIAQFCRYNGFDMECIHYTKIAIAQLERTHTYNYEMFSLLDLLSDVYIANELHDEATETLEKMKEISFMNGYRDLFTLINKYKLIGDLNEAYNLKLVEMWVESCCIDPDEMYYCYGFDNRGNKDYDDVFSTILFKESLLKKFPAPDCFKDERNIIRLIEIYNKNHYASKEEIAALEEKLHIKNSGERKLKVHQGGHENLPYFFDIHTANEFIELGKTNVAIRIHNKLKAMGLLSIKYNKHVDELNFPYYDQRFSEINELSLYYEQMGNFKRATKARRIINRFIDKVPFEQEGGMVSKGIYFSEEARLFARNKQYTNSINSEKKAIKLFDEATGASSDGIIDLSLYPEGGEYEWIVEHKDPLYGRHTFEDLNEYITDTDDFKNFAFSMSLYNIARNYFLLKRNNETDYYYNLFLKTIKPILEKEMKTTSYRNQQHLLEKYGPCFTELPKSIAIKSGTPNSLKNFFDASLFIKGVLLNSYLSTKHTIYYSNDEFLIAKYNEFKIENQNTYNTFFKLTNSEDLYNRMKHIDVKDGAFKNWIRYFGGYIKNKDVNWDDIQQNIERDEIAIEFLSTRSTDCTDVVYYALVIKKDYKNPILIKLFKEKDLHKVSQDKDYTKNKLYDLIWKPLQKECNGCKKIYFSPSGKLNTINIEVLPLVAGKLTDANFYRLSSTRQLAYIKEGIEGEGAAIFGGLQYDMDEKKMQEERSKIERKSIHRSLADFDLHADSIDVRGGVGYLPYTKDEAITIHNTIKKEQTNSAKISLYTDSIGIEENFKALDGKRKKIIHLSTHGFYYKEDEAEKMKKVGFNSMLLQNDNRLRHVEDKQLIRSGLLMSGCNNVLKGKEVPEDADDGILYAKEIAAMDLRGLDLVSLSACQTGLGDISGEGVFGLQRAFKKAGAQSILMSLWKVDDAATMLFMTRFYENYLSKKMTKVESLYDAQEYLRQKGYTNPKDWAAFILLDAI